jgi:murein DD-endopeptidase MepM/ murein hydrolase activator NlpD
MRGVRHPHFLLYTVVFVAACKSPQGGGTAPSGSASAQPADTPASAAVAASASPPPAESASAAAESASAAAAAPSAQAAASDLPKADPSQLALDGKAIQGGLVRAKLQGKIRKAEFPGHPVIVSNEGAFLVGFSRDAKPQEKLKITLADGTVIEHVFEVEQRKYETDKVDGLPENTVNLDTPTRVALAKSEARIDPVRKKYTPKACYKDGFVWPAKGKLTSRYGQPRILNGTDGGIHWGVDIAAAVGTAVWAPACGKVVFVEKDVPLSGHTVIIDHGHGLTSTFLHLNSFRVKVGDEVKQRQLIGTVGMTGRTNGPHLDWRMNLFDTRIDPELLTPPMH